MQYAEIVTDCGSRKQSYPLISVRCYAHALTKSFLDETYEVVC